MGTQFIINICEFISHEADVKKRGKKKYQP